MSNLCTNMVSEMHQNKNICMFRPLTSRIDYNQSTNFKIYSKIGFQPCICPVVDLGFSKWVFEFRKILFNVKHKGARSKN